MHVMYQKFLNTIKHNSFPLCPIMLLISIVKELID